MPNILNLALTFAEAHNNAFRSFSESINRVVRSDFVLNQTSLPHLTIIQFEAEETGIQWDRFLALARQPVTLDLAGLLFLPAKDGNIWVEISALKSARLVELQQDAERLVGARKIHSGTGDAYRPHITVARAVNSRRIPELDVDDTVVRRKGVTGTLALGASGPNFQFERLLRS